MNQRGVTLVELLVTVSIMVIVLVPIVTVVSKFLVTNQEVMGANELQHEARFIVEYFSDRVKNEAEWVNSKDQLILNNDVELWYDASSNRILRGEEGSYVFSQNVKSFDVKVSADQIDVHLVLHHESSNENYELQTIIYRRDKHIEY
jgi:prepilin-type N-terminal cleavage/methylation domain-containing protein